MSGNTGTNKPIYTALAPLYDHLMKDVDYEAWADHMDDLIHLHSPDSEKLLELACGTGSVSLALDELGYYRITATDQSEEMIRIARTKAERMDAGVRFLPMDFLSINLKESFDLVFLVFDSINYLLEPEQILRLHRQVRRVIRPGGFFIFDFTTPSHSRSAIHYLDGEDAVVEGRFHYRQQSRYDESNRIHTNRFWIDILDPESGRINQTLQEEHHQRAWTLAEMDSILDRTEFSTINRFDDFHFEPADEKSRRITIVSQCLKTA